MLQRFFGAVAIAALWAAPANAYQVIVSNELSGDLTVIDGESHAVLATIPVGKRPRGLHVSQDGRRVYVALSGSPIAGPGVDESKLPPPDKGADGIGIVDLAERRVLRIIRRVSDPEQVVASADQRRLFVASEDTGQLLVLDTESGKVLAQLPVGGEPEGLAISPDDRFVYVTSEEEHTVSVVDTASLRLLTRFDVGQRPRSAVFSKDGTRAYITGEMDATLTIVDARKHRPLHKVRLRGENVRPMGVQVDASGKLVFVSTGRGGTVLKLDAGDGTVRSAVNVGPRPWGIALSPDDRRLYTANGPSNDISVVDTATMQVLQKIAVGTRPWTVVIARPNAPAQ